MKRAIVLCVLVMIASLGAQAQLVMTPQYSGYVQVWYDGTATGATSVLEGTTNPYSSPTQEWHTGEAQMWIGFATKVGTTWQFTNGTNSPTVTGPSVDPAGWLSVSVGATLIGNPPHNKDVTVVPKLKVRCSAIWKASMGIMSTLFSWENWVKYQLADTYYATTGKVVGTGTGPYNTAQCWVTTACINTPKCQIDPPAKILEGGPGAWTANCEPAHICSTPIVKLYTANSWSCVLPNHPICAKWAGPLPQLCSNPW
jgi:hypothetical protein